jgi:hypothetical protein
MQKPKKPPDAEEQRKAAEINSARKGGGRRLNRYRAAFEVRIRGAQNIWPGLGSELSAFQNFQDRAYRQTKIEPLGEAGLPPRAPLFRPLTMTATDERGALRNKTRS